MLIISIIREAAVAIVAVLAARRGNPDIYGLAFTPGAYVLYDVARLFQCSGWALVRALPARHRHRAHCGVGTVPEIARRRSLEGLKPCRNLPGLSCSQRSPPRPRPRNRVRSLTFAVPGRAKVNRSFSGQAIRIMPRSRRPSRGSTEWPSR